MASLYIPRERYEAAFEAERVNVYPAMDAIETRTGFALDRGRLEAAARVLACPVKANPPNWQHGRLIYALTRQYIATTQMRFLGTLLDIGTAKGFSALCLYWAAVTDWPDDDPTVPTIVSVDVIDPASSTRRNSIAECDGQKTLAEILGPWPESAAISFVHETGIGWLMDHPARVNIAFVDGKHQRDVVATELGLLYARQEAGDLVICDDVQIEGVRDAVSTTSGYDVEYITLKPERQYAVLRRR